MLDPRMLKTLKKDTKIWPNVDAVVVDMLAPNNSVYETTVIKEQADLALFLKTNPTISKLNNTSFKKLMNLIEEYGSSCYQEGSRDCEESNAGASI